MQKFIFKYKKELLYSLLLLVTLNLGAFFYFQFMLKKESDEYARITIEENKALLDTTQTGLNRECDTIFDIKINTPKVLRIMSEANNPDKRDIAREKLFELLEPTYKLLQRNGIRQFHFHLPGNISFLRFHKVHKYGDSLKGIRYSIDLVNKTKKIVRGFEEGRIFNGFRNVYPLFYHDKFVGTVEISYSIRAIAETLRARENSFYGLLIEKRVVQKKVWRENRKYYLSSELCNSYVWDKKAFKTLYGTKESAFIKKLHKIEKLLNKKHIQDRLKKNHTFLISFHYHDKSYIAIFQSLKNIENIPVGYIVTVKENNFIALNEKQALQTASIAIFIFVLVTLLFFLFLKKEHDTKEYLSFISNYDPLTKLLNRRGYKIAYNALIDSHNRNPRPFALLFLDIDHFKRINDTYGHDIGDDVLKKLAELLKKGVRRSDIIARWGGEEFVLMLDDTNAESAQKVAEKLRKNVENYHDDHLPRFTISIGVIQGNERESLDSMIKKADIALYKAKESGRNKVVLG